MLLILFLLVSQNFMVTPIGCCHSDRNKDHLSRVSCVSQGLTAVSDGIDPGTEVLVLSQNMFVSLSWAAYTTFTRLHELDLSQNLISNIIQSGKWSNGLFSFEISNTPCISAVTKTTREHELHFCFFDTYWIFL